MIIKPQILKITDIGNIVFGFIAGLLVIILIFFMFSGINDPAAHRNIEDQKKDINLDFKSLKKPIQYYERILGRRKLFVGQGVSRMSERPDVGTTQLNLRLSDLQLLGIVSGARGPQAIINDVKTGQSYYCSGNEEINGFFVKEVLPNKVIMEFNGERLELKL